MADIRHYLNGVLVNPRGFENAKIVMDWVGKKESANITIDSIRLVGSEGEQLRDRILSGLNGGVGFFEGEPYKIEVGPIGNSSGVFDGFLDFTQNVQFIDRCEVECTLKREQGTDWITEVAEGFSYRFLREKGFITDADLVNVPYVINFIPDGAQLLICSISVFILTKELIELIRKIAFDVATLINSVTPIPGGPFPTVSWRQPGDAFMILAQVIASIAYAVSVIIAIVGLVEEIIEQLMPPKRFHKGIPVKKLFQRACDYLGLTLQSTLLDSIDTSSNRWVLIPSKNHRGGEKPQGAPSSWRETGVPTQSDVTDTFAGVIRTFKNIFNADYQLKDGVFIFERRDYFREISNYVIPDTFTNQTDLFDVNGFNTDEIRANYLINYNYDLQDQNTLANQTGRILQAVLSPKTQNNPKLSMLKGLTEINIPFSMPVRKNELTVVEEVVKVIASIADLLTGQLGNPQSLSGKIANRVGAMNISSHFLSIPKLVVMNGSNLQLNQRDLLSASKLWDNYHFINSFKPTNGVHNQYWLYKEQKIPFCFDDFVSLLDNNQVQTKDGETAEIETLEWNVWEDFAVISYRVNRLYDENFELTFLYGDR